MQALFTIHHCRIPSPGLDCPASPAAAEGPCRTCTVRFLAFGAPKSHRQHGPCSEPSVLLGEGGRITVVLKPGGKRSSRQNIRIAQNHASPAFPKAIWALEAVIRSKICLLPDGIRP